MPFDMALFLHPFSSHSFAREFDVHPMQVALNA
jgi:hypothetical protein